MDEVVPGGMVASVAADFLTLRLSISQRSLTSGLEPGFAQLSPPPVPGGSAGFDLIAERARLDGGRGKNVLHPLPRELIQACLLTTFVNS